MPTIDQRKQRLDRVRDRVALFEGARVLRIDDGEFVRLAVKRDGEPDILIARFEPAASYDEIMFLAEALDDVRFLLALLADAFARIRCGPASEERAAQRAAAGPARFDEHSEEAGGTAREAKSSKDYAAEAAMKCADAAFKKYLEECHGLERPLTDERVAGRLRHVLAIGSRRELNSDEGAAKRWRALVADFDQWRRG